MTLVIFDPEARSEFLAATQYYEESQRGLCRRYRLAVESAIHHITEMPFLYRNFHIRLFTLLSLITSISLRSRTINVSRDIGRIEFQILREGSRSEQITEQDRLLNRRINLLSFATFYI